MQVLHLDRSRGTKRCLRGPTSRLLTEQRLFEESFARGLKHERREKEKNERKKREEERARKEKEARQEERARKLARARDAQEEDEARDKKGKWPRTTQ